MGTKFKKSTFLAKSYGNCLRVLLCVFLVSGSLYAQDAENAGNMKIEVSNFENRGSKKFNYLSRAISERIITTITRQQDAQAVRPGEKSDYQITGWYRDAGDDIKVEIKVYKTGAQEIMTKTFVSSIDETLVNVVKETRAIVAELAGRASEESVSITSEPEGADVYINEELAGQTPYSTKEMKPGDYAVKIEKEGYDSKSFIIHVEIDKSVEKTVKLLKENRTRNNSFGFGIYYWNTEAPDATDFVAFSVFYRHKINFIALGLDVSFGIRQSHSYDFSAPYGTTATDDRFYSFVQMGPSLLLIAPWKWAVTPYAGVRTGAFLYWDYHDTGSETIPVMTLLKYYVGPVAGLEFTLKPNVKFFIEGRYDYIFPQVERKKIDSVTLFSGANYITQKFQMNILTIGGGISADF